MDEDAVTTAAFARSKSYEQTQTLPPLRQPRRDDEGDFFPKARSTPPPDRHPKRAAVAPAPASDEEERKKRRVPFTLQALVVIAVLSIALSQQAVWLISVSIRPDEVGPIPPFSEAIAIAAITGLLGVLGGAGFQRSRDEGR